MTTMIRFRVSYPTLWGQSLAIVGQGDELGNWDPLRGVRMSCVLSSGPNSSAPPFASPWSSLPMSLGGGGGGDEGLSVAEQQHQQKHPTATTTATSVPVWEAVVTFANRPSRVCYKYVLLSEEEEEEEGGGGSGAVVVARTEPTPRRVALSPFATPPERSSSSSSSSSSTPFQNALFSDTWLDDADPGALMGRAAFTEAIFAPPPKSTGDNDTDGDGGGDDDDGGDKRSVGINNSSSAINNKSSSSAPSLLVSPAAADDDAPPAAEAPAPATEPLVRLRFSVRTWDPRLRRRGGGGGGDRAAAAAAAAAEESLAVLGSAPELGAWQTARAVRMRPVVTETREKREESGGGGGGGGLRPEPPLWQLEALVPTSRFPISYRFAVVGSGGGGGGNAVVGKRGSFSSSSNGNNASAVVVGGGGSGSGNDPFGSGPPLRLEAGENRVVSLSLPGSPPPPPPPFPPSSPPGRDAGAGSDGNDGPSLPPLVAADGGWLRPPEWRRWRGAGLAVPLFSVRSRRSQGVGGFADIAPLARWCARAGLRVLQLLPLNDTRCRGDWRDSYPYATLSAFALHPIYCDVEGLIGDDGDGDDDDDGGGEGEREKERKKKKNKQTSREKRPRRPPLPPAAAAAVAALKGELDSLDAIDYERVLKAKMTAARAVFDAHGRAEVGMKTRREEEDSKETPRPPRPTPPPSPSPSPSFVSFYEENAHWLRPHAAHRILSERVFGHAEHWRWGSLSRCSERDLDRVLSLDADTDAGERREEERKEALLSSSSSSKNKSGNDDDSRAASPTPPSLASASPAAKFEWWLQWKLHSQLLAASREAATRYGVALKGDLPIGVDETSVDAWWHPELFRLGKGSTGAPPDAFDAKGQAWGFPTYDWDAARREDYAWWRRRLSRMSRFFQALRVDHVLGFFRIWELEPGAVTGACGRFRPARPVSRGWLLRSAGLWDVDRLTQPHVTRELAARALAPYLSMTTAAASASAAAATTTETTTAAEATATETTAATPGTTTAPTPEAMDKLIDRFFEPVPGVPGRLRLRPRYDGEAAIDAIGRGGGGGGEGRGNGDDDGGDADDADADAGASATTTATTSPAKEAANEALRQALLSLRQNVCLIEDPDLFDDGGEGGGAGDSNNDGDKQESSPSCSSSAKKSPPPRSSFPLLHPRFNLAATSSFSEIEPSGWRDLLKSLHDDHFYGDRHERQWSRRGHAALLPLLEASDMLVCGEDLGLVPACAAGVLRSLGILGLRVQRMPARGEGVVVNNSANNDDRSEPPLPEFGDPALYPYLSVASPSTHDMPPLRCWWEGGDSEEGDDDDDGEEKKRKKLQQQRLRERFWYAVLGKSRSSGSSAAASSSASSSSSAAAAAAASAPPARFTPELASSIVASHAHSPAMLAIFALQDVLAMSEGAYSGGGASGGSGSGNGNDGGENDGGERRRPPSHYSRPPPRPSAECINDPSVRRHYWRYRCHASVEEMERDEGLTDSLRRMLESAGRDVGRERRVEEEEEEEEEEEKSVVVVDDDAVDAAAVAVGRVAIS